MITRTRRWFVPGLAALLLPLAASPARAQGKGVPKLAQPAKAKPSAADREKPAAAEKPRPDRPQDRDKPPAGTKSGEVPGEKEFNQCSKLPPGKRIKLTLKPESELNELLAWISGMTCTQFIVPSTIRSQKVTIISPMPITAAEGYRLFLGALESVGLTVVPAGGFLKIIETTQAKEGVSASSGGDDYPADSRFVTRLIRVRYADIEGVKAVLNALRSSKGGDIQSYAPGRTLIITDTGANIHRMMGVLQQLDTEGAAEKIWILKLKHSSVGEVASMVSEILGVTTTIGTTAKKPGQPSTPPAPKMPGQPGASSQEVTSRIIIDERGNQLFVVASEQNYARIRALILRLDKAVEAVEGPEARLHLYRLSNADVDEISGTLQGITGINVTRSTVTRRGLTGTTAAPPPAPAPMPTGASGQKQDSGLFAGDISIAADRATNSLIVVSSATDYYTLRRILEKLDTARKQVFVEATILEVSMEKTRKLGLSFHGGAKTGSGDSQSLVLFGSNPAKTLPSPTTGGAPGFIADPLALQGLAAGVLGPTIEGGGALLGTPGISIPSFGAFLMALQNNLDVDVLSSPFLTTTDNEEAEITVGENIPFVSTLGGVAGGAAGGIGGIGLGTSVQRQDVALKLKLRPHVSEGGFVRLDIDQEISEATGSTQFGPKTSKRTVRTMLTVRDQQTVVIGGLVSDKVTDDFSKIPLLGDIPILGYLFKQTTHRVEKRNLILVLTPYVINDQNDLKRMVERKMRERREFLERFVSADERRDVEAHVDYARRRGLFEEINVSARDLDDEDRTMEAASESMKKELEQTPVDLPSGGVETSTRSEAARTDAPTLHPMPAVKAPPPIRK